MRARWQAGGAAHAALVAAVTLLAGLGVLAVLAVSLPLAFQEEATSAAATALTRPATETEAGAALEKAVAALASGDEDAWRAALPASGDDARQASSDLFRTLGHLPWTSLAPVVEPVPSQPGRFRVRLVGELAGVGPADRLVADRVLQLEVLGEHVIVTGDLTPAALRRRYFMAYREPEAVQGRAAVVLTEATERSVAEDLVAAEGAARDRLALLGIDADRPVLLYLYASRKQLKDALAGGPRDRRFQFFSAPAQRYSAALWWPRDVNILAPALEGDDAWLSGLLAHELTHAFTVHWFAETKNDPMFLAEGLAVAVQGGRTYEPLRQELAGGNERVPLETAIAVGSLWIGNSDEEVQLAYLEAGSVVLYILDAWGLDELKAWVTAVADSDLTPAGLGAATRETLGVTWDEFVTGWTAYVQTLP
jgi:hypothetical protein